MSTVLFSFPHKTSKGKTTLMIGIFWRGSKFKSFVQSLRNSWFWKKWLNNFFWSSKENLRMILIMESFKFSHAMLTVLCNFPHKTAKGKTTLMIDPHDAKTKTYSKRKLAKGDFWGAFSYRDLPPLCQIYDWRKYLAGKLVKL